MRFHKKVAVSLLLGFFVTTAAVSDLPAQDIKSGVVNSRNQILNPTTTQQQQAQRKNPPVTPSQPGDNGVGNGEDPQPPGNPPVNDGPGTGPGKPGKRP
jgi:hypothetical protein